MEQDQGSLGASAPSCGSPAVCEPSIDAVQVNAADYSPQAGFDGWPFSAKPEWLIAALTAQYPAIVANPSMVRGDFDYAVWGVKWFEYLRAGEVKYLAWPGDWIVRGPDGQLTVVPDRLFKSGLPRAVSAPVQDEAREGGEAVRTTPNPPHKGSAA